MTREIPITKGLVALVDDDDFQRIAAKKWRALKKNRCNNEEFYACRTDSLDGKRFVTMMHREILAMPRGKLVIDHINGNTLDNRKANLRACTPSQNCMNSRKRRSSSQFKGVSRHQNRWVAYIKVGGKHMHIGSFVCEIEAADAYDARASEAFGEFAALNHAREALRVKLKEVGLG